MVAATMGSVPTARVYILVITTVRGLLRAIRANHEITVAATSVVMAGRACFFSNVYDGFYLVEIMVHGGAESSPTPTCLFPAAKLWPQDMPWLPSAGVLSWKMDGAHVHHCHRRTSPMPRLTAPPFPAPATVTVSIPTVHLSQNGTSEPHRSLPSAPSLHRMLHPHPGDPQVGEYILGAE